MERRVLAIRAGMNQGDSSQRQLCLLVAPITAAALIAQQVASNAIRDALFLTWFPVTTLPYFMAAAAILAIPAAESSGRLLARFGPGRLVPFILGVNSALFLTEWRLLGGHPRVASGLVYFHASVLGAIGISAFFSSNGRTSRGALRNCRLRSAFFRSLT